MYSMTPKSTSPIPFVHTHTKALPKSTGGFYYQQAKDSNVDLNASKSQLLLGAEKKLLEHRCEDKIELAKHKAFIAHQAAFIPPRPPTPIQKDDQSVQTENQVVLQRELDSLNDYQSWISGSIDPYLKELRTQLLKNKPENIPEFIMQYTAFQLGHNDRPITKTYEDLMGNTNDNANEHEDADD